MGLVAVSLASLRIVFAGTPDFAARHLDYLLQHSDANVVAVYTQPDRPAGRGKKLSPSPVKTLALKNNLPVFQPADFKHQGNLDELAALQADLMIVVAYGILLPPAVLDTPRLGCINVHASLLPRWRGAAPIQRAIESGDRETGITIMQMDEGLDTGDMLAKTTCVIAPTDSAATLHDRLIEIGAPLLLATLRLIADSKTNPEKQDDSQSTYAKKISKAEAQLDWRQPAKLLARKVRAFNPFPICFFIHNNKAIRVWEAVPLDNQSAAAPGSITANDKNGITVQCKTGSLLLTCIQLPGKKAQPVADILNAYSDLFAPGITLEGLSEQEN